MSDLPRTGTCRCGATGITVTAQPLVTAACHCTGCRKMSASAFSLTAMFPGPAFSVTRGETVVGGAKGPELDHHFCPACMTWMFTRLKGMGDLVNVRPTMFDAPDWCRPFIETMTAEKLDWARTPAEHSFEKFPGEDEFGQMLKAFAERR